MMRKNQFFILVLLLLSAFVFGQTTITGKITDSSTGEALPGASVIEKGTTNGSIAMASGDYNILLTNDNAVLVFSYIGYLPQEVEVESRTEINISLKPDYLDLDELVVVGYGTQKKSVVTGAIAKVDQEILEKSRATRIEQSLQGQTAGVVIMNNSGQPGDNLTVRIRGVGTVKDADPLFIVDGLPLEKEGLDFLNPSDVESVEVLKDAASTAIYGTRGANGVVIITTKQGKKHERLTVSYNGYYGVQNPWHKMDMLNASEYMELINEGRMNDNRDPIFDEARMDTLIWDTDWQDEMYYYNAPKQSHTVSVTGGSENSTFASSISYLNQDGIVAKGKSNFERIGLRLNATHNVGRLTVGTNLNFVNINRKGVDTNNQFSPYSLIQALNTPPIVPVTFDDGSWATPEDFGLGLQEITNPVAALSYLNRKQITHKAIGGVYAELEIIEGLTFKTHLSSEIAYVTDNSYTPLYNLDATHFTVINSTSKGMNFYSRWNIDNTLRYTREFNNHSFTALAGVTYFKNWSENLYASRSDLIFDSFENAYLDNATGDAGLPAGGYNENRLASIFGRLNYNYRGKYLFEGVIRRDGSSKFGPESRFAIFPAVSAGWVISKEDFFPAQEILTYSKIRMSWGQNGNDQIADFQYSPTMSNEDIYIFGVNQDVYYGILPQSIPNPQIKWETSEQFNVGANLGFLRNRVTLNIDYYDKRTIDWLLSPPTMLLLGNFPSDENIGEVANKGFEFELAYKNSHGDFSYNTSFIAATNKSEVISINNANGYFTGGNSFAQGGDIVKASPGMPLGYFWGYDILGVFQSDEEVLAHTSSTGKVLQPAGKPGDFIFNDKNDDGVFTDDDKIMTGTPYPKFTAGLNLSFEFKGFDFYTFWYSALGHNIYVGNRRYDVGGVNYSQWDYDHRWTGPGSTNEYPRFAFRDGNKNYRRPSEFFIRDADYLRLKNLTFGYTLPSNLTQKVNISKLRIYLSVENLLTFTKYPGLEVEIGGEPLNLGIDQGIYPQARTLMGGVNITF